MSKLSPVITVDGPSGTGKGTVSQLVAQKLGWWFLDSGVLYRVLALAARQHAVSLDDVTALATLATQLNVQTNHQVVLDGIDVTEAIRTETCSQDASIVAAFALVRAGLLQRQRDFQRPPGLVTDGRDMGSVVFPDAELKFFLNATQEERARRRYRQLKEKGIDATLAAVLRELEERDERDKQRAVAPLKPASDAVIVDTTQMTVQEVYRYILSVAQSRFLVSGYCVHQ